MSHPVDDTIITQLHRTLGRLSTQASVVASNLANVDTPGYRALRARFPEILGKMQSLQMSRSDRLHLDPMIAQDKRTIEEAPASRVRLDGNTVDVDQEMTALAATQMRYSAATQLVRKRFALLRYAATDGRG